MEGLDWIFDPISFAIGAVASALISIFIGFFIKRPRLRVSGGGGGNVRDGTKRNYLRVENELAWFGFNIPETKILGFRLHPSWQWGLSHERWAATNCRAVLYLEPKMEAIGQLWWLHDDGTFSDTTEIRSGTGTTLTLFSRRDDDTNEYFLFNPVNRNSDETRIPPQKEFLSGSNKFTVHIHFSHTNIIKIPLEVEQTYNRLLYIKNKGGSFLF